MMKIIQSPLRYPGGKSKAISTIVNFLPEKISEYREPFVGGGSLFIHIKQNYPNIKIWINDKNINVYSFWKIAKEKNDELVEYIQEVKEKSRNGRMLFYNLKEQLNNNQLTVFERAANFFIMNRISFSGLTTSGGYSKEAFKKRFTISSIERVALLKEIMQNIEITYGDYSNLLNGTKNDVFIYLDPPYLSTKKSKLYGQNGDLHYKFDHQNFKENVLDCKHNILITYDNSILIKNIYNKYKDFCLNLVNFQYGMNNIYKGKIPKAKELIITNYKPLFKYKSSIKDFFQNINKKSNPINFLAHFICFYFENNIKIWKSERVLLREIEQIFRDQKINLNLNLKTNIPKILEKIKNLRYLEITKRKRLGNILRKTSLWNFNKVLNNFNNP